MNADNYEKGGDIMDVWLDSGVAWHTLKTSKCSGNFAKADVVVEGVDQFRGWFQSSLLTSMAINETAPFEQILVHGFAVDDHGRKMSKSEGNVIFPETVIFSMS